MLKSLQKGREIMIRIKLSKLLGERRMTQIELSRKTGIRPSTVNDYYHEFAVRVSVDHLDLICEALDCSLSDLIEYVPNKIRRVGTEEVKNKY